MEQDIQTIDLETPIQFGDQEIKQLEIRKPNVAALQGVKLADLLQGDIAAVLTILPRVCTPSLTKGQINQLDVADVAQIAGSIMLFLQPKSVRAQLLQQQ